MTKFGDFNAKKRPMKMTFDLNEGQATLKIFYGLVSLINSINIQSKEEHCFIFRPTNSLVHFNLVLYTIELGKERDDSFGIAFDDF